MISAEQFKQAAWNSDFEMVKRFVEAGGDIHACGNNGVGALVTFNTEILDYLVSTWGQSRHALGRWQSCNRFLRLGSKFGEF